MIVDVFFRKRAGGGKLPLRGLAALVSIHTRFSRQFVKTPALLVRSIWHAVKPQGYGYYYVRSSSGNFPADLNRAGRSDYAAAR
jgi:hypothetical protein